MSKRFKVVVTDFVTEPLEIERRILGDIADVVAPDAHAEKELEGAIENADAVMLYHNLSLSAQTINRLENCKLIVRCGVGFDNVDRVLARSKGIPVANVPDYGTEDVADSAIGMMLSLTRGIHTMDLRLRASRGPWMYTQAAPLRRLRGRVFGIIGLGRIGTATALRAKALGMDVVFYDPYVPDGRDKSIGVRRAETLEDLLKQSFVLSPHCPLTPETKHIVNRESLSMLPKGSYVINTSRGGVVDVLAVLESLTQGHIGGAAIDVLETEPPSADHPLIQAWRDPSHPAHYKLIINPHAAFYTEEGLDDMRIKGSENCRRVLLGDAPRNVVN